MNGHKSIFQQVDMFFLNKSIQKWTLAKIMTAKENIKKNIKRVSAQNKTIKMSRIMTMKQSRKQTNYMITIIHIIQR